MSPRCLLMVALIVVLVVPLIMMILIQGIMQMAGLLVSDRVRTYILRCCRINGRTIENLTRCWWGRRGSETSADDT